MGADTPRGGPGPPTATALGASRPGRGLRKTRFLLGPGLVDVAAPPARPGRPGAPARARAQAWTQLLGVPAAAGPGSAWPAAAAVAGCTRPRSAHPVEAVRALGVLEGHEALVAEAERPARQAGGPGGGGGGGQVSGQHGDQAAARQAEREAATAPLQAARGPLRHQLRQRRAQLLRAGEDRDETRHGCGHGCGGGEAAARPADASAPAPSRPARALDACAVAQLTPRRGRAGCSRNPMHAVLQGGGRGVHGASWRGAHLGGTDRPSGGCSGCLRSRTHRVSQLQHHEVRKPSALGHTLACTRAARAGG